MSRNDKTTEELTPKQETLITLLVSGINIAVAAKQAGIGDATARRWLKLAHFQLAYRAAQQSLFDEALKALQRKVGKAIDTLDRNMDGEFVQPNVQVRAAQIVLEQALEVGKVQELETRLADLENKLQERGIENGAIRRIG